MASFTNGSESSLLQLIFNATNWTNIADNTVTAPLTNLFVSLHTADPGEAGSQTTNETAYSNYARIAVARTSGGWTISGTDPTQVVNAATITFAQCGVTGATITHWGIGTLASGAGVLIASGPVGPVAGPYLEFTATLASPGHFQTPGSTYSVDDRVSLYHTPTGTLPTGVTEGTVYFIGSVTATTDVTLSTTASNGTPVNTSTVGAGVMIKQTPLVVSTLVTPSFAASALKIMAD
jgi:hypothetical protein